MWFGSSSGFDERAASDVAGQFDVDGAWLTTRANGRRMGVAADVAGPDRADARRPIR